MRVVAILLCSIFLISIQNGYGQDPVIHWQKIYGGPYGEYAHSIKSTSDGGYIVGGYTEGNGGNVAGYHGNVLIGDLWVIKLDATGEMVWQRCIGGFSVETGAQVRQTADGGYLVAGSSGSIECEETRGKDLDFWVVRLSPQGDMIWQKRYGGGNHEYCYGLDLTGDGGFFVAGHTESFDGDVTGLHGKRDLWVVKADANGNMQWQKTAGGSDDDDATSVRATPDGGCILAGSTRSVDGDVSGNHGKLDLWMVKLSNTGNLEWQRSLGGTESELAWGVTLAADGGYVAAGFAGSSDGDVTGKHLQGVATSDFWVVKLSTAGTLQWQHCYGGDKNELAYDIQSTVDGGFVVGGSVESDNGDVTCHAAYNDVWVIKISGTGNLLWQKDLGGSIQDEVYSVEPLADGSVLAAGISCSPDVFGQTQQTNPFGTCGDFWIIKLNPPGSIQPAPYITLSPFPAKACGGRIEFVGSVQYGGTNPQFQWSKNGAPVGTNSAVWKATGLADNDVVSLTVTSGGACSAGSQQSSNQVVVKANNPLVNPQLTISASKTYVCGCEQITFTATLANGGSWPKYRWFVNGIYTGVNATTFISNSLKPGDQVTCVYNDKSICMPNDSTVSNVILLTGNTVQAPYVSIQTPVNPVCAGSTVTFYATPADAGLNPSFQWKLNGVDVGTNAPSFSSSTLVNGDKISCVVTKDPLYNCVATPNASSNVITMTITQAASPAVTITSTASTICIGTSVTFTANAVNAGANPTYEWKLNGAHVAGNTKTMTTNAIADGDIISCDIIVDPIYTCSNAPRASSNNIAMTVILQLPPTATVSATGNDVCAGNNVNFTVAAQNAGANPAYRWMINGVPQNNTTTSFNSANLSDGDKVYCIITPGQGNCAMGPVSSDTIIAVIHPLPQLSVSPADTVIKAGDQVQLRTIANNVFIYQWSQPNKLQDATVLSPRTIALTENTTYVLSAESDMGCKASATAVVRVGRALVMPNAFTPNNDGSNDLFRIPPAVLLDLKEFSIFDRWGNKIFTTKDIAKGWDGTFKGQKLNTGVYVWMITGNNEQGTVNIKGTVNLVR
jgi:gliding motility-associated-like protein